MPLEQDVLEIGRQLEKLVSEGQAENATAADLLKNLKRLPITLSVLQKTRIGMSVNAIRKAATDDDIKALATALVKAWKKLLEIKTEQFKKKQKASNSIKSSASTELNTPKQVENYDKPAPADSPSSPQSPDMSPDYEENEENTILPPQTGDIEMRKKCREMIKTSLVCDERPAFDGTALAANLEEAIFVELSDQEPKYKNRIKSRVLNLRDKNNPDLRISFIDGDITSRQFAIMTSEEMASKELNEERKRLAKEAFNDHQVATQSGTKSTMMKCGKCGKRNVSYNQLQTRSSDEPMTTFCFCNECGHRWKFC